MSGNSSQQTSTSLAAPPVLRTREEAIVVAQAVAPSVALTAAARDRGRTAPLEELEAIGASGLLGVAVPASYGGPELAHSTVVEIFRILARADSSVAQLLLSHFVVTDAIRGLGDHEPAPQIYGAILATGAHIGNATVERGTRRSNERTTTAVRDGDSGWRITGRKYYATGALGARWIAVAATDPAGNQPVTAFISPHDEGVELRLEEWSSFGQRATHSGTVILNDVFVANDRLVEEGPDLPPDQRPPSALGAYDQALHAAIDIGTAGAALDDGAQFVTTKSRPWFEADVERAGDEPHIQRRFGELTARLWALEALLDRSARLVDAASAAPDDENTAQASLSVAATKALAAEFGTEIANGAFELMGTSATDEQYDFDRHWRNLRVHSLHDPARWKLVHVGRHTLYGTRPPRLGTLI